MAGASESAPERSSRATSPSRSERRTTWTVIALASVAASTTGRSKGNRASGSLRRTSGMTAKDSASRTGPRKNGCWILDASNRLRALATLISPESVRIAQAQEVGPCTSTPLTSAIPPKRILVMGRA